MDVLDPDDADPLYHGGSFNGNLLSCVAGRVSLEKLTAERIAAMETNAATLAAELRARAQHVGVPLTISGDGSVMGVYLTEQPVRLENSFDADDATRLLHLAALNHGVFMGPGGEIAFSTVIGEEALELVVKGLAHAFEDVARAVEA
jgi:glutamate-1-semialdehyde 2,1-aminomutase